MGTQQARWDEPILFEMGSKGRRGYIPAPNFTEEIEVEELIPEKLRRKNPPKIPALSEIDVVRHFVRLSQMNFGVDSGSYLLGSCTMKLNPKINEKIANFSVLTDIHPLQPQKTAQGALELMYRLQQALAEIVGVAAVTLQPAAGAHGEFTGVLLIRAYHEAQGELEQRTEIFIPDSAHGTNFSSAAMAGFKVIVIPSNPAGQVDLEALKSIASEKTAGMMITNPNTLGIFESEIEKIANIIHDIGGLLYYDGANLNAILGKARPGDMGFDIVHFNLHKTFSTPHGGGGPGAGPVGVVKKLVKFLPVPVVTYDESMGGYILDYDRPHSIGKIHGYYGNFAVLAKALAYIFALGPKGLEKVSETAVLNANYLMRKLEKINGLQLTTDSNLLRKHEFTISSKPLKDETGISALDIAKGLIHFGIHAPTIYFPPIVPEALMFEPTETESKQTLDLIVETMEKIVAIAKERPKDFKSMPQNTAARRIDEVTAARRPILSWKMKSKE